MLICVTGPRRVLARLATPASEAHDSVGKRVSQTAGDRPVQPLICHPAPYAPRAGASGEAILANLSC
jgi:hypothetical protein